MDADLLSMPLRDGHLALDSDNSATRRLKGFTKQVMRKVDSPLIRQAPKQPSSAKPVLPLRSKWLTAQSLSRVPMSKRGEILIMQCMGLVMGLSTPSMSG